MKQQMRAALAITVFATVPALAMAGGAINFKGKITKQTCTVTVDGSTGPQVTLPDVSVNQLTTAGMTAGLKTFTVDVSGCDPQTTAMNINTVFWGDAIENGALKNQKNQASGGATQVALQLLSDDTQSAASVINLNGTTAVGGLVIAPNATSGSKTFAVRYLALGQATAGDVESVVNYDITYQ